MSVIQKLVVAFLALALLPVLLIGWLMYLGTSQALTGQVHRQLESVATIQSSRVATTMTRHRERLVGLASQSSLQAALDHLSRQANPADQATIDRLIADAQTSSIAIKDIMVAAPSGTIVSATNHSLVGQSLAGQNFFTTGLRQIDTTNLLYTAPGGQTGIYLTSPVGYNGGLAGVVVIKADLTTLFTQIQDRSGLGNTGEVVLVKQDGNSPGLYLTPLRFDAQAALKRSVDPANHQSPFAQAKPQVTTTIDRATDYRDHPVVATVNPVSSTNWRLMAKIDRAEAYAGLSDLLTTLLILIFVTLVVTVFSALFVARSTIDPIITLAQAAGRMSKGDLTQRVIVPSKDEFGSLAQAFNNMAAGLEKIDQAKSEFVALMSHQLRTPTTAVKGFIAMLLDGYAGKLTPKQTELLQGAFEENERQVRIVNDILLVAAANTDQMSLTQGSDDMNQMVANVLASQAAIMQEVGQKVTFNHPKTPLIVSMDVEKIRMTIENIVSNAVKYSPEHTQIHVDLSRTARYAILTVTDQGFGIAPADIHKLFQKFSRLDNPHSTQAQGSGLGLYLAKKIVELHHGDVSLRSQPGKGTTVTIRLPFGHPAEVKAANHPRLAASDAPAS